VDGIVIIVIGAVGLLDSLYFTLVYYGWMAADSRAVPSFCRMESRTCRTVLETPEAKIFRLPNSVYGLAYYAIMIAAAIERSASGRWPAPSVIVTLSVLAAVFSLYLGWTLIFRLRVPCPLCFLAHIVNFCLTGIIVAAVV